MIVKRAETLGVCKGVRRALKVVERALEQKHDGGLYTIGPLIHNPRVVEDFRLRGVEVADDISKIREGTVIVSAHGIGPEGKNQCRRAGIRMIDATCPDVRRVQKLVADRSARGVHVLIVGDAGHREVIGIRGYASASSVIATEEEARTVDVPPVSTVVGQTTFRRIEYEAICRILRERSPGIEVLDTSCSATETRQESLIELARGVDALLVIGGRQSANTKWLFRAALQTGKPSWHIEGSGEIPADISRYLSVGISAGASTPDFVIDEVEKCLRAM
jgi:4-hydroxy-3-methylbut-2-enyl diphosphate reductase